MASYSGIEQKPWLMNFSKWLQCRLEDFGFDAYIYTRYILSVLRQPDIQMDPYDDDIEMLKGKFSSKNFKKSIWHCSPGDYTSAADDPFKATLFECLMDDGLDIDIVENLVDDIVEKYRQMNSFEAACCEKEDNISLKPAKCISCIISYDEAFPPLAASTAVMLKNRILSSASKRVADFCFQNGEHSPADLIVVSSATSTVFEPGAYPKRAKMLSAVYDGKGTQLGPSDLQQAYDNIMEIAFKEWCCRIGVPSVTTIGTGYGNTGISPQLLQEQQQQQQQQEQQQQQQQYGGMDNLFSMYAGVRPYFLSSGAARTETYWDMYRPLQREPAVVSSLQYQQPQLLQRYDTASSSNGSSLPPQSASKHYECEFEETFPDHVIRAIDNLLDDEEEDNLLPSTSSKCVLKLQSVVTVPIRRETHFVPISLLSSPEERHYPVEELATRNGSLASTVGEGQFFVFHDNSTNGEIVGSNCFRVKFRVTKVDKACQTDDLVDLSRVRFPTLPSSTPSPVMWLSRFGQLELTPSMTSAFKPWRKLDNKLSWPRIRLNPQHCWTWPSTEASVGAGSGSSAVVDSGRNPSDFQDDDFELLRLIRPKRVSPDPLWIFQDEQEEDLLIRYSVSNLIHLMSICGARAVGKFYSSALFVAFAMANVSELRLVPNFRGWRGMQGSRMDRFERDATLKKPHHYQHCTKKKPPLHLSFPPPQVSSRFIIVCALHYTRTRQDAAADTKQRLCWKIKSTVISSTTMSNPNDERILSVDHNGNIIYLSREDLQRAYDTIWETAITEYLRCMGILRRNARESRSESTEMSGPLVQQQQHHQQQQQQRQHHQQQYILISAPYYGIHYPLQRESSLQYQRLQLAEAYEANRENSELLPQSTTDNNEWQYDESVESVHNEEVEFSFLPWSSTWEHNVRSVMVPIDPETHFATTSPSCPEDVHPAEEFVARSESFSSPVADVQYFVFRDNLTTEDSGHSNFQPRFRVTKVDKACQTDDWLDWSIMSSEKSSSSTSSEIIYFSRSPRVDERRETLSASEPCQKQNKIHLSRLMLIIYWLVCSSSVARLVAAMDDNIHLKVMDYWKEFSIADYSKCVLAQSMGKLRITVALAHQVHGGGFKDLQELEVTELIESHMSELTDEELVEMTASIDEIKDADDDSATDETEKLTLE
ncbi:hypothetical protein T07_3387 [Trichinella nelsoni]|uniref:Uncharacterized protein n=1 Tax=Trichinella nelsoni TaxID=6336 RepID=A0A0V0RUV0_9BILA|nr:hypothetical protein T07_3387 [Trichinella nelsoni]